MVAIYLCDESNRGRKVEGKRTQVFAAENQSDAAGIRKGEILSNPSTSCRSRLVFVPHSALFFFCVNYGQRKRKFLENFLDLCRPLEFIGDCRRETKN